MGGEEGDLGWKTELLGHYEVFIKHISNVISIIILLLKHCFQMYLENFD